MLKSCATSLLFKLNQHSFNRNAILTRLVTQRNNYGRSLFTSPANFVKDTIDEATYIEDNLKLDIKETADVTHIDAIPVETGRQKNLIKVDHSTACVLCRLNLRNLNYTDVMILSQFIKRNGSLVTYHESKLCTRQYLKVVQLIKKAQRCNLIQRPPDYLVPGAWHDLNTYLEPDRRRDQPMKVVKKEYWKL